MHMMIMESIIYTIHISPINFTKQFHHSIKHISILNQCTHIKIITYHTI